MSFQKLTSVLAVLVIGVVGLLAFFATTKATTHATSSCTWSIVPSPNAGVTDMLYGVAALSPQDIWAVGNEKPRSGAPYQALIEHWSGTAWSIIASPTGMYSSTLYGVVALSAHDVWAVGNYTTAPSNGHTLIEHWDGSNWTLVASPDGITGNNTLKAVTAVPGSSELWAVGYASTGSGTQTLLEHWNGNNWSVIPGVSLSPGQSFLNGVAAFSANDVWAVGHLNATNSLPAQQILIEHWNGSTWSHIFADRNQGILNSVTVVPGTNQLWAVGMLTLPDRNKQVLIERWYVSRWQRVPAPTFSGVQNLLGVAVIASRDIRTNNVEVVGYSNHFPSLMLHRYGGRWNVDTPQTPGTQSSERFSAITVAPQSKQLWAVGGYSVPGKPYQTLVEVHC